MSESVLVFSEDGAPAQNSIAQVSGGAMLRRAREAQGLHIAALAVSLKVPVKKLEALETDRFDLLPDTVFVRALASSVCRTLKIDPDPILENLPSITAPRLKAGESGINVPFRASRDVAGLSLWEQLSKPVVLAVLALLVGAAVLVFFPFAQRNEVANTTKSETAAVIFPTPTPTPTPVPLTTENPVPAEVVTPGPTPSLEASGSAALLAINPAPVASSASLPSPAASALPVMVPGSGAMTGIVTFRARGPCWVEVVDASGTVQVRKTMTTGEVVGASGVLPLSVVVGRADATEVQVRGKPFDLTRIAKDNVARFEVK
jgi:cytoskeleton protein RodZ